MTSSADLTNLKELLSLYKSLRFSDSAAIEKYNSLVEWGTSTYWKIGVQKVANVETSISDYYDEVKINRLILIRAITFSYRYILGASLFIRRVKIW